MQAAVAEADAKAVIIQSEEGRTCAVGLEASLGSLSDEQRRLRDGAMGGCENVTMLTRLGEHCTYGWRSVQGQSRSRTSQSHRGSIETAKGSTSEHQRIKHIDQSDRLRHAD